MNARNMRIWLSMSVVALTAVCVAPASAGDAIGTVVDAQGSVEFGRADIWSPAGVGMQVQMRDILRTGPTGRVRVFLTDGSIVTLGTDTTLHLQAYRHVPGERQAWAQLLLEVGKVHAQVGDGYVTEDASFEIETPTAVTRVTGTAFVMSYDRVGELSEVMGHEGQVAVFSTLDRVGRGVAITASELTQISRGQLPTRAEPVDEVVYRQRLKDFEFVGRGGSLVIGNDLLSTATVDAGATADALQEVTPPPTAAHGERGGLPGDDDDLTGRDRDVGSVLEQPPSAIMGGPGELGIQF